MNIIPQYIQNIEFKFVALFYFIFFILNVYYIFKKNAIKINEYLSLKHINFYIAFIMTYCLLGPYILYNLGPIVINDATQGKMEKLQNFLNPNVYLFIYICIEYFIYKFLISSDIVFIVCDFDKHENDKIINILNIALNRTNNIYYALITIYCCVCIFLK